MQAIFQSFSFPIIFRFKLNFSVISFFIPCALQFMERERERALLGFLKAPAHLFTGSPFLALQIIKISMCGERELLGFLKALAHLFTCSPFLPLQIIKNSMWIERERAIRVFERRCPFVYMFSFSALANEQELDVDRHFLVCDFCHIILSISSNEKATKYIGKFFKMPLTYGLISKNDTI